jgi:hypothetical protein
MKSSKGIILQTSEELVFNNAQLGAAGNTFLMVFNPDTSLNGDFVVEVG